MYDGFVELRIMGVTRGVSLRDARILVLKAEGESNLFPILISEEGNGKLMRAMKDHDFECSHLMIRLARRLSLVVIGIRLMQPTNGDNLALIDFADGNDIVSIAVHIEEAAVVAMETDCSFWVKRDAFERMNKNKNSETSMSLPLGGMSNELIAQALQSAVESENFELASLLRDELKRRDKNDELSAQPL